MSDGWVVLDGFAQSIETTWLLQTLTETVGKVVFRLQAVQ